MADYPNVPDVAGVPPVLRSPAHPTPNTTPVTEDTPDIAGLSATWGLFYAGYAVVDADSVFAFDMSVEYSIATFPIEQGSFGSYNKVRHPRATRLSLTKGGSRADKTRFLAQCETAVASYDLYTVITPEVSYANLNPKSLKYSRGAKSGAGLITVEMAVDEIRPGAASSYTNTKLPSGWDTQNRGEVAPVSATNGQTVTVSAARGKSDPTNGVGR